MIVVVVCAHTHTTFIKSLRHWMPSLSLSLNALRFKYLFFLLYLSYFAVAASIVVICFLLFCIGTKIWVDAVDVVFILYEMVAKPKRLWPTKGVYAFRNNIPYKVTCDCRRITFFLCAVFSLVGMLYVHSCFSSYAAELQRTQRCTKTKRPRFQYVYGSFSLSLFLSLSHIHNM